MLAFAHEARSDIALIRHRQKNETRPPAKPKHNHPTTDPWSIQEIRRIAIPLLEIGFNPHTSSHGHSVRKAHQGCCSTRHFNQKATVMFSGRYLRKWAPFCSDKTSPASSILWGKPAT